MHRIVVDPATGLIELAVEGFWDEAHVADFARDLAAAKESAAARGKPPLILCDYSSAAIQAQAVVAALQRLVRDQAQPAEKVALYTDGRLATMQARRVAAVRADMAVFDDRDAALAWLIG